MKRALIFGITGQDGSYLSELLLQKGYEVHGALRRSSSFNTGRIDHIFDDIHLHYGDVTDPLSIVRLMENIQPNEIYNLAAMSHVKVSFDIPKYSRDSVGLGAVDIYEAERILGTGAKIYNAASSEMFGSTPPPQNESSPFSPRSPYAAAKMYAYYMGKNYRQGYGMFISSGILFNHESPRRGETFVTRKITRAATRIKLGLQKELRLGNIDACRDWGHAKDYVRAMWLMLQQESADDYVIAMGTSHSVKTFIGKTFGLLGLAWRDYVTIDPNYFRPTEVESLQGDPRKARVGLGWLPEYDFDALVEDMVSHDLELAQREKNENSIRQS
jgi:GDPmannose 4,6-dehydratase